MTSQQSQASGVASADSARAPSSDGERVQERARLLGIFKNFYAKFSEELYRHAKEPQLIPFKMPNWPSELIADRNMAKQRLHDPNSVLKDRVHSFYIFADTSQQSKQVVNYMRYELILLKLVQDELNGVPGADVHPFQRDNLSIVEAIRLSHSDSARVTRIVLYDVLKHCDMDWHCVDAGSDAVVMPCPKKHTYCAECVLKWIAVKNTNTIQQCPSCRADTRDNGVWKHAFASRAL